MTAAWIEEMAYGPLGLSRREVDLLSWHEFIRRLRGYDRAERPKWERFLMLENALTTGKGRTYEEVFGGGPGGPRAGVLQTSSMTQADFEQHSKDFLRGSSDLFDTNA